MKKKFLPYIIYLAIFVITFVLFTFFYDYITTLFGGFFIVPFYYHILIFFAAYFLVVFCHELTHAIAFLIQGIRPKMILILIFLFHKDTRWHLKIDPNLIILGGGMVMPDFHKIHNEKDIRYYQKATSFSLITAPTFTIISASLMFLLDLIFFYNQPIFTVFTFYIVLFSAFFTYTSTLSAQGIFGDFVAHRKINSDPIFGLSVVSQFVEEITPYLYGEMKQRLSEQRPSDFSIHLLNFYSTLLEKGIHEDTEIDEFLLEKSKVLAISPVIARRIARQHQQILVLQQTILYLYRCQEDTLVDQLLQVFSEELDHIKSKQPVKTYYMKQTNHLLGRIDATEYLSETRPFRLGLMDLIVSHLPEYQAAENDRIKPIQRFEKKEMIHLDNEELM
jgi:hypothetical protein